MMRDEERLRRLLGDEIGSPAAISDRVWEYLRAEGHIAAVESGARDIAWLGERVANFLEASSPRARTRREPMHSPSTSVGDHMLALSLLLAKEAEQREDIRSFRNDVLAGRLIKPEEVDSWIQARTPKNPQGEGMYLTIEAPRGIEYKTPFKLKTPITITDTLGGGWRVLQYSVPDSQWARSVATPAFTGNLARLRFLSEDLAKRYHWQEAQATVFVLTGQIPVIPSFRWSGNQFPPPRRITLNIDLILSPKELAARYADVRQRLLQDKERHRELSRKHMSLAFFIIQSADNEPWAKRLRAWNARYPKWKYGQESNFRRDAGRAIQRILTPVATSEGVFRAMQNQTEKKGPRQKQRATSDA
jgi:hypothetical protein